MRTCDNCMFQRYVMTEKGQAWFCRREPNVAKILHYESAKDVQCQFED